MKRSPFFFKPLLLLFLLLQWLSPQAQTICENFSNGLGTWQAVDAQVAISNIGGVTPNNPYLQGRDDQGSSSIFNTGYNFSTVGCGTICFDYRVFNDAAAGSPRIRNTIRITGTANGQPVSAVFQLDTLNFIVTENSGWATICAPLNQIANGAPLPSNNIGTWVMSGGASPALWNQLVNSATQVSFSTDVVGSSIQTEEIGIDNFCITPAPCCVPTVNNYFFQNAAGEPDTAFCYGEDVFMNANASLNETSYYIDIWRRPIGSTGIFTWHGGLGWFTGQAGLMNLSQAFAGLNPPVYLTPDYEYQLKLALSNPCDQWNDSLLNFTVKCCENEGAIDGCFKVNVDWNTNNTYDLNPVLFNTYANVGAVHEWYVLSSPNLNAGPYTPLASMTTTSQTGFSVYTAAQPGIYYYVIHKIKTACGEFCTQVVQYQQTQNKGKDSEAAGINTCTKIDCCFVNDYWPNGPGSAQPFTGEFNVVTVTNGSVYAIYGTPLYSYNNNSGITPEWYLFSSPNQNGGPYTLVHQATGANYYYPSANNGLFYFLIHRVKSACGEKCYGRRMHNDARLAKEEACDLCGEIDCAILDSLINPCPAPVNLRGDCVKNVLSWNAVPGAGGYMVEISYNDPNCCRTNLHPTGAIYTVTTNYLDLNSILSPLYECLRWRVLTRCATGASHWSAWQCYDCKRDGEGGKKTIVKSDERAKTVPAPVIAPNPNNGTMTLLMQAPGDLTIVVEVYNAYGKLVQQLKQKNVAGGQFSETLKLPSTEKGIYTVVFKTNYGTFNKKVIVQ